MIWVVQKVKNGNAGIEYRRFRVSKPERIEFWKMMARRYGPKTAGITFTTEIIGGVV